MKINFQINYRTHWGENLFVLIYPHIQLDTKPIEVPLQTKDGQLWTGNFICKIKDNVLLNYHYEVRDEQTTFVKKEWKSVKRILQLSPAINSYFVQDTWRDLPQKSWLYSACMTDVFYRREIYPQLQNIFKKNLLLKAQTTRPQNEEHLYISGNCEALGNWDPQKAIALTEIAFNEWGIVLDIDALPAQIEYKFIVKADNHPSVIWEQGNNRFFTIPTLQENESLVVSDLRPQFAEGKNFKAAGVVIPIFSLRSNGSWGCGDFGDLKLLTNWVANTHQKIIQLLPINDTTITHSWTDSYPYNAISVYALHPIYADIRQLPPTSPTYSSQFERTRKLLNTLPQVDYEQTLDLKLKRLFCSFEQEGNKVLASTEFKFFFYQNVHWLPAYAMFCTLRDEYKTADYKKWPKYSRFSQRDLQQFCVLTSPYFSKVRFWYYVQYILHCQLKKAVAYAHQKGIVLKGDIPIGISPCSVDAWTEPSLFNLNSQAGAPPDDFSKTGQNWGFPTYNWAEMAKDGYAWWKKRFAHMAQYFDAYRIDHVLGFFRIWEIPTHSVQGLLGQFTPSLPLTPKEMLNHYGFNFKLSYTQPYITDQILLNLFGNSISTIKTQFLIKLPNKNYILKPIYQTQAQLEEYFKKQNDSFTIEDKNKLFSLISNVLFVEDSYKKGFYHPRIAVLQDTAMQQLSVTDRQSFIRLYNDFFFVRNDAFWKQEALKKLPELTQCTRLLCCAEDLGMIPACVPEVMKQLQMLSLEIERMPKQMGITFADTNKYPYLSVATPSTHDMSTLRLWWNENEKISQLFWNQVLQQPGKAPKEPTEEICEAILNLHLQSPSMLTLISLQDWLSMDVSLRPMNAESERINIPANPRHYWRYRMHIPLENLLSSSSFNEKIKKLIEQNGR